MTVLAVAALSLAVGSGGTVQEGRFTLSTGLLTTEQTLVQLSKASGMDLRAAPAFAHLPLMLRVRDAEPRALLARVADLLGGEWRQEGSAYVLSTDATLRRKLARASDAKRVARLTERIVAAEAATRELRFDDAYASRVRKEGGKVFDALMKAMTEGGEMNPGAMMRSPMFTESPANRAINALLLRIGAEKLGALVPGERMVYALVPTRAQGALPPGSREILAGYVSDNAASTQAMKNTATGEDDDMVGMMSGFGAKAGAGPIADAHLEVWPSDGGLTATLKTFDAKGETIGQGFGSIETIPAPATITPGEPLVVGELGREWARKLLAVSAGLPDGRGGPMASLGLFGVGASGTSSRSDSLSTPLTPVLRALLADPVANSLGEPLFAPIAAAIPGDLIATVPDAGLKTLAALVSEEKTTDASAVAALEAATEFSVTRDGTLTIVGASTPARLHREFADRRALRDLVASVTKAGYLRLDDAARYAVAQRSLGGVAALGAPMVALFQGAQSMMFGGDPLLSEFETLRIYGGLNQAQRTTLAEGRGIPFTALGADGGDALARLLFDSPTGPTPSFEENDSVQEANVDEITAMFAAMNGRAGERTVRFADGVPRDGFLSLTNTTADEYRMTDSNTGATVFGGAEALGFLRGAKDVPFLKAFVSGANYDRFTPARTRTLNLKFSFAPRIASSHSLQDHEITGTETLTYDRMPQAFRDEADEAAKGAAFMKAPPARIKP